MRTGLFCSECRTGAIVLGLLVINLLSQPTGNKYYAESQQQPSASGIPTLRDAKLSNPAAEDDRNKNKKQSSEASCFFHSQQWNWTSSTSNRTQVLVPAYPGSGSALFRQFIQALAGPKRAHGSVYNGEQCQEPGIVTCKTHWPCMLPEPSKPRSAISEAIVLIRHPKEAIPSWFSNNWESHNNLPTHSIQAPENDWLKWRDAGHFEEALMKYKVFVQTWDDNNYLVVPYQAITSPTMGPALLAQVVRYLFNADTYSDEKVITDLWPSIQCVWQKVAKERATAKRKSRNYSPSFTPEQHQAILNVLQELSQTLSDGNLKLTMLGYIHDMNLLQ
jgi:hypothetical protein